MSEETKPQTRRSPRRALLVHACLVLVTAAITAAIIGLLGNIARHKEEARQVAFTVVQLDETVEDPAEWGKNFPRQYDSYLRTVDTQRTKHGGSEAFQKLDEHPVWRELFAGYAFGVDFREERGHAYMLSDQRETERVTLFNQPGACLHCHASNLSAYRQVGLEHGAPGNATDPLDSESGRAQLFKGFEVVCAMPYQEATELVQHPVSCLDCHDPQTMRLRVTRPAFLNGIRALAASDDPLPHLPSIERWRKGNRDDPYEPNEMASRHELRSLTCAQCHVEYYFKGEGKLLTYPWHNGLQMDEAEAYYETAGKDGGQFVDWEHAITKAPMIKAQHPEFEMWSQGIHARAGVACADCHMPYQREGAIKISSHHVRSPLLDVAAACQTCHNASEEELLARAENIQDRTRALMDRAEAATFALVQAIAAAMEAGATDEQLTEPRQMHRKAQWRLDYVYAENSLGFHADQEATRILGESIDYARQGQVMVAKLGLDQATPVAVKP